MRSPFSIVIGTVLIFLGVVFLLDNFGYINSDWILENFWPLAFIILGIAFIARRPSWQVHGHQTGSSIPPGSSGVAGNASFADHLTESEVFGDIDRQIASKSFSGGTCSVVFGNIRLDLTQVELLRGEQSIRINSVFGNVHLQLPQNLEYSVRANHVAGGVNIRGERRGGLFQNVTFQSGGYATAEKRLAIHVSSVFGDTNIS